MAVSQMRTVYVEFISASLAYAHDHLPAGVDADRIVEMSAAQANLLGVQACPTCRSAPGGEPA